MTEQFAFIVNNQTLTFADLKANHGLYLRSIEQTAAVSWDLATSKNPYIDGSQVNNRTANSREMVIEFGYDRKAEPADADAALFSYFAAADDGKITVKKTRGNVNKYIDGVIRDISQEVYTDEPVLQIVLLTDPFWRGEQIILDMLDPTVGEIGAGAGFVDGFKFKGEAQTGFSVYLQIDSNGSDYAAYLGGNIFGKYFRVDFTAKALPYTVPDPIIIGHGVDMIQPRITMGDNLTANIYEYANVGTTVPVYVLNHKTNIIGNLDENTQKAVIYPNRTNIGYIYFDATTAEKLTATTPTAKLYFSYTPLYIR